MHNGLRKMISRVVVILAVLALGASVANAQIARTLTLSCSNMGATTATITSWTWLAGPGAPIDSDPAVANANVTGWTCAGNGVFTTPLSQPIAGNSLVNQGFTAGVVYTVHFSDSTPDCTMTDGWVNPGQGLRFSNKCADTGGGKRAAATVKLGR